MDEHAFGIPQKFLNHSGDLLQASLNAQMGNLGSELNPFQHSTPLKEKALLDLKQMGVSQEGGGFFKGKPKGTHQGRPTLRSPIFASVEMARSPATDGQGAARRASPLVPHDFCVSPVAWWSLV